MIGAIPVATSESVSVSAIRIYDNVILVVTASKSMRAIKRVFITANGSDTTSPKIPAAKGASQNCFGK